MAWGSGADALSHRSDHVQETLRWSGHDESVEWAEREALIIRSPSWREATGVGAGLEERLEFYFRQMGPGRKWRRQWQPTPVLLPGESHGRGSLV